MQIRVMVPICRSFFLQNAGKARVYGAELETAWQATETLNVTLGLGYADAKLNGDQPLQQGPLVDGRDGDGIPYTPDFTGKLGVQYQAPLSFLPADLMVRTDWAYTAARRRSSVTRTRLSESCRATASWICTRGSSATRAGERRSS